jgi:hypothetical protein
MLRILFALVLQVPTLTQEDPSQEEPLSASLEELTRSAVRYDDRRIRVVDEWDLYQSKSGVQLLREGAWKLCATLQDPTGLPELLGKRVEVVGRFFDTSLARSRAVLPACPRFYLHAEEIVEQGPKSVSSHTETSSPKREARPTSSEPPPEILYTTPQSGTREIAPDTTFTIHFSRSMDESTFPGHVFVREGAIGEVPTSEVEVEFSYDEETKTLKLTPTTPLGRLKLVHIVLHRGIAGSDGTPLHVEPPPPKNIESRRAAERRGEDLDELLVLEFTTRGY